MKNKRPLLSISCFCPVPIELKFKKIVQFWSSDCAQLWYYGILYDFTIALIWPLQVNGQLSIYFHFQIAGIILDNIARNRTRHIWFTISADLIVDARRWEDGDVPTLCCLYNIPFLLWSSFSWILNTHTHTRMMSSRDWNTHFAGVLSHHSLVTNIQLNASDCQNWLSQDVLCFSAQRSNGHRLFHQGDWRLSGAGQRDQVSAISLQLLCWNGQ